MVIRLGSASGRTVWPFTCAQPFVSSFCLPLASAVSFAGWLLRTMNEPSTSYPIDLPRRRACQRNAASAQGPVCQWLDQLQLPTLTAMLGALQQPRQRRLAGQPSGSITFGTVPGAGLERLSLSGRSSAAGVGQSRGRHVKLPRTPPFASVSMGPIAWPSSCKAQPLMSLAAAPDKDKAGGDADDLPERILISEVGRE